MVIGITGGVGAGKSQVLSLMAQEFGAAVLIADDIAHQLTEPGYPCYKEVIKEFGRGILLPEGLIDRKKLAAVVFADPLRLQKLNMIIHPGVKEYIKTEIKRLQSENPERIIVIEAALLIEDHYDEICDEIWYIYAEEQVRKERLRTARGYSDEKSDAIMKNQLTDEEFRRNCRKVVDNSYSLDKTLEELKKALEF